MTNTSSQSRPQPPLPVLTGRQWAVLALCATAFTGIGSAAFAAGADSPPQLAAVGLQINVHDLDAAVAFYTGSLDFEVAGGAGPGTAALRNGAAELILLEAGENSAARDDAAEIRLNLRTSDLQASTAALQAQGVPFRTTEPKRAAVGPFMVFEDPSGNLLDLIERPGSGAADDIGVFNVGITVTDMTAARRFYCDQLGFEIFSEDFYPPVLPLNKRGTVALVLHEIAQAKAHEGYPTVPQTLVVLATPDLAAALQHLRGQGVDVVSESAGAALLRDPAGNHLRLLERPSTSGGDGSR